MKARKIIALLVTFAMTLSLTACGQKTDTSVVSQTDNTMEAGVAENGTDELVTLDFFCKPANYQGIQGGWFGKIIQDKFNLEINVLTPAIGGDELYQTRSASGDLGDIISVSKAQLQDCINAGIILDITDYYENSTYLKAYDVAVEGYKDWLGTDRVYGIPSRSSTRSALDPQTAGSQPSVGNFMRVDLYKAIGAPALANTEDLLNALKAMQENYPVTEDGAKTYPFSMFKDWDGIYMKFPITMIALYGYSAGSEGASFMLLNADGSDTQDVAQDDGVYYQMLKLLYNANQRGLVDPDSSSQTWDMVVEKTKNGQILWSMWPWASVDHFNTDQRADEGIGFQAIPVEDQIIYADGYNQYGNYGNVLAIGANCENPERAFEFLDWMASPEYMELTNAGPMGLTWEIIDGKAVKTEYGKNIDDATSVPEEYGGGNYNSGSYVFNEGVVLAEDIDPNTGESYSPTGWSSIIEGDRKKLQEDWTEIFGEQTPVDYLLNHDLMEVAPGTDYSFPADSSEIATKRAQCGEVITTASWNMVFAGNDDEFHAIWEQMKKDLIGFGYEDVLEIDKQNINALISARQNVLGK